MNEYDSARMVDVLRESGGYELTDDPAQADLLLLNTCSVREKAQEKVFSQLGGWRQLKKAKPDLIIGVGGCVASQEGEGITQARAVRRSGVRSADAASPAGHDRRAASRTGRSVVDVSFPEIEKFDALPAAARRRRDRVRVDHGRLQQVLHVLRRAVHARRRSQPAVRIGHDRDSRSSRDQGVREITLLGQNVNAYNGPMDDGTLCDLGTLIYYVAEVDGHRAHSLHDFASGRVQRLADRGVSRRAASSRTICTCRCSPARTAFSRR